jgi:hypothetical protein
MQKRKFDLTSDIIQVDLGENEENNFSQIGNRQKEKKNKRVLITMAVDEELRKEYKMWCTRKGLKMAEAFLKGYELLKKTDFN